MKMGAGLVWGLILIIIGISILLKVAWGINIMRVLLAAAFILIGIRILFGKSTLNFNSRDNSAMFNDKYITEFPVVDSEFNTVFGKTVYNFADASVPVNKAINLEFNAIFGHVELILPPGLPVRIKADAVFGAVKLPDNATAAFGSAEYSTDHDASISSFVTIKAGSVFGNIEIIQNKPTY